MLLHCCGRLILSVLGTRTLGITKVVSCLHLPGQMQPEVMMPIPGIAPQQPDWSGRRRRSPGKVDFPRAPQSPPEPDTPVQTELCTPLPTTPSHQRLNSCWPNAEMERNSTVLPPTLMSSTCLLMLGPNKGHDRLQGLW